MITPQKAAMDLSITKYFSLFITLIKQVTALLRAMLHHVGQTVGIKT
jgi:hypothetical protein